MNSDLSWMPPQIQIRNQSRLLGADRNASVVADNELGFTFPPNLTQKVDTLDFALTRKFDAIGFSNAIAWPEHADIVFLGDSILMGEGVGVENGLVAVVNDRLPDNIAINLSLPGAGLERQNRLLIRYGEDLSPKLVVTCLLISYDFQNDIHFNAWLDDSLGRTYNDFRLSYGRRMNKQMSGQLPKYLTRRALYNSFLSAVEPLLPEPGKIRHSARMSDGQTLLFDRDKVKFAKREFSETDPEILQLGEGLDRLKSITGGLESALIVVLLPSKEELFALSPEDPSGNALTLVKKMLEKRDIDYLDVYEPLRLSAQRRTPFFKADIHYNEFGNEVVAEVFLNWYANRLSVETP